MADALVGGAFLSAFLQDFFDRIASREVLDFFSRLKLNTESLKKLRTTLLYNNAVLNDAEEKQIKKPAVKEWVNELKDTAYHAQDLLDEINTVASRYKLEAELEMCRSKVRSFNLTSLSFSHQGIELKLEKILGRLESLAKERDILSLKEGGGEKTSRKWPTTSLVEESSVYGTVQPYHLMQLTDEDCWLLFAKHAFGNIDSQEHPELELIGKKVVKKCNGLPLATSKNSCRSLTGEVRS
nr:putative disease resistance rpp13-like protein 1 [Quercus suber]